MRRALQHRQQRTYRVSDRRYSGVNGGERAGHNPAGETLLCMTALLGVGVVSVSILALRADYVKA